MPAATETADNPPVGEREKRLARNEALYRDVNERVSEVAEQFETEPEMPIGFICECGAADCTEPIALTFIFSAPGFEETMRCNSVPAGETPTAITPEEQLACAHLGHAESAGRQDTQKKQ